MAILAFGFALFSASLIWLALDPETRSYPVLAIFGSAMFLLTVPMALVAMFLERVVTRFSTIEPNTESERLPETRLGSWRSVSRFPSTA
jgi:uncharacterized membrane protein YidH (DUF202 family)